MDFLVSFVFGALVGSTIALLLMGIIGGSSNDKD